VTEPTATDTTEAPEGGFQPPEALQPVLTGLRERFEDAIKEISGHRGEVVVELSGTGWSRSAPGCATTR